MMLLTVLNFLISAGTFVLVLKMAASVEYNKSSAFDSATGYNSTTRCAKAPCSLNYVGENNIKR